MKPSFKIYFTVLALLALCFSSCSKDDDDERLESKSTCNNTITDIAGSYSLVKREEALSFGTFGEKPVPACMVEDRLILKSDGTTEYIDSGISCGANLITGSWSVTEGDRITIDSGQPFGIIPGGFISSFDCTYLVITAYETDRTYRMTLRK